MHTVYVCLIGSDIIKIKKLGLYFGTSILLISGTKIELCRHESKKFTDQVNEYTSNFISDDFYVAAHRGYSSLEVENTKNSIIKADQTDYIDYIEMDVRMTEDKKLILSHDNLVINADNEIINISKNSYDSICNDEYVYCSFPTYNKVTNLFNTTNGDIRVNRTKKLQNSLYDIPTLLEGLKCCKDKKIILDLKFEDNTKEYTEELVNELSSYNTSNIIFQSDDITALLYLKSIKPNYNYSAIIKHKSDLEYAELFDNVTLKKTLATKKTINKLLNENKKVAIWTVNDPEELYEIKNKIGSNYKNIIYITDYPDVIASCLNNPYKVKHKK